MKKCLILVPSFLNDSSLNGMSSLTWSRMSLPFLSLSLLYGVEKPSIWNWPIGKDLSNLVSDINKIFALPLGTVH